MKYIRTKDGRIIKVDEIHQIDKTCEETYTSSSLGITFISPKDIIKEADTIEELIQSGDLIKVDMKKLKLVKEDIIINYTIKERDYELFVERSARGDCDRDFTLLEEFINCKGIIALYIEQKNGDFKKIAKANEKGELELL